MNALLRLFLLTLGLFVSCIGFVVCFFWAYPYEVIYWHKTFLQSLTDSFLNYALATGFLSLSVFLLLMINTQPETMTSTNELAKLHLPQGFKQVNYKGEIYVVKEEP